MNVVSMVANLVKERDYYKHSFEECLLVIKQLSKGLSDEFEYIHPLDLQKILDYEVCTGTFGKDGPEGVVVVLSSGKKYKQSVFVPAKTKQIY